MGLQSYRQKLHDALHEMEHCPVNMNTVAQATALAELCCKLREIDGHGTSKEFSATDAKCWTAKMENEDGTTGAHWTMEQTGQVASIAGAHYEPWIWYAALNMMYSDYYAVAAKYGLDRPEFYADLAMAFLDDKDAGGPERKIAAYYHGIAKV